MFNSDKVIENINKIHYLLKESFDKVLISEKSNKSDFYFDIVVEKKITLPKGSQKTYKIKFKIPKQELISDSFKWLYQTNPLSENSSWIERESRISIICEDLNDIITWERLDESYLKSIKEEYQSINESNSHNSKEESNYRNIMDSIEKYSPVLSVETDRVTSGDKLKYKLLFLLEKEISISEKLIIETQLNQFGEIDYIVFEEKKISLYLN